MRGDGSLFLRGSIWWAAYWADGQRLRESLHTTDEKEAGRRLQKIRKARERGAYLLPRERRVTINDLLDDLITHLEAKGGPATTTSKVKSHLKAVRLELGHLRAAVLDTATVERLQVEWTEAGTAPATINRRLERLRQAYLLASRRTPPKVKAVPHIPMLRVSNARQGFLSRADFEALLAALTDDDVRDFVEWFWWTGMRPKEIRSLTWEMFDKETWTLALDPKAAKTGKGRTIPLQGPLRKVLERRLQARRLDCPLIFHRVSKGSFGSPVKDFRLQWKAALKAAGLAPGLIPYDLRRTAVRNMIRGGTSETVTMEISGHRTRSSFDRYNITSVEDLRAAMDRTAAYVESLPAARNISNVAHFKTDSSTGRPPYRKKDR